MSLSIFDYGDGRFRLFHGEREVGWVEGRIVGFSGFESIEEARHAATAAYDALCVWLARQRRDGARPRRGRPLGVRHDGAGQQLTLGGVTVGQLLTQSPPAEGQHGFQLLLPPRVGATLTAAQVLDHALSRHRERRQLETAASSEGSDRLERAAIAAAD